MQFFKIFLKCCAFRDSWQCVLGLTKSPLGVLQLFTASSTTLEGYLCSSCCNRDTSLQRLPMSSFPAFSGLCCSWWGLPGCGDVVSSPQESSGWVWRRAALPGTGRLCGFGWGWAVPRVQMLYFVWSGLGDCPFGYTLPSLPQWRPKINIAQIVCPSNKQSVKIAVLPLRLRLIKVGSDCRSRALLGVCSNEVFAALKRHRKNMRWHNLQKLYH